MTFVVFDTEFMADKGLFEEGFNGWKNREVVQIAAIKVSGNLDIIGELNLYIKPKINLVMSDYFTKLTGLTNDVIYSNGMSFPDAYQKFKAFVGDLDTYSHGWGSDCAEIADGEVMNETMSYYGMIDNNPPKYKNIAPWFQKIYLEKNIPIQKQSSGEIAKLLGKGDDLKEMGLCAHNALYDVYSILVGLKTLGFEE